MSKCRMRRYVHGQMSAERGVKYATTGARSRLVTPHALTGIGDRRPLRTDATERVSSWASARISVRGAPTTVGKRPTRKELER